jgi:hypothetical protein
MAVVKHIYLAFLGKRDPFRETDKSEPGPNLAFLNADYLPLREAYFLVHKDLKRNFNELEEALAKLFGFMEIKHRVYEGSPVDLNQIFRFLDGFLKELTEDGDENLQIHCNTSPGTPQMQFALLLLSTKYRKLQLYQVLDGREASQKKKEIVNIALPINAEVSGPPEIALSPGEGMTLINSQQKVIDVLLKNEARVSQICGETGVGKTTIYREFARKNKLTFHPISTLELGSQQRITKAILEVSRSRALPVVRCHRTMDDSVFRAIVIALGKCAFGGGIESEVKIETDYKEEELITICVPPLRDNPHGLFQAAGLIGVELQTLFNNQDGIKQELIEELTKGRLARNFYELEALLFLYFRDGTIPKDLASSDLVNVQEEFSLEGFIESIEVCLLRAALEKYSDRAKAARSLGMKPNSFRKKVCEQYKLVGRSKRY